MVKIKKTESASPPWLKRVLAGVCFWIGHRRSLYRDYPLGESAIVAELCNLLYANLPREMKIVCEVKYSKLITISEKHLDFSERSRIDLCVCEIEDNHSDPLENVSFAFEVKRGRSSDALINADLKRLYKLKAKSPKIRAFLLLVSESYRPRTYVNDDSFAIKKNFPIAGTKGYARVRSVSKAVTAITNLNGAHYACAIEVCL